ncbi:MAG: hypothetical protein ACR5K2_05175 [Wolbachia sp.]
MVLLLNKAKRGVYYRIVDEYILFYLIWIEPFRGVTKRVIISESTIWSFNKEASLTAWTEETFEAVCFKHANKIGRKLNIERIAVICGDWQYHSKKNSEESGVQIDLIFD